MFCIGIETEIIQNSSIISINILYKGPGKYKVTRVAMFDDQVFSDGNSKESIRVCSFASFILKSPTAS